jgi:Ser/Thr protein kinase RdoA (MazF antagonist)
MHPAIDPVLLTTTPSLTADDAPTIARATFGVVAHDAADLGSERDRAFLLRRDGHPVAVLKVSNAAEHPEVLDMEAAAALHALGVDPMLPIARPLPTADGAHRAAWQGEHGVHWVRCYDVLPGTGRTDPLTFTDRAVHDWGTVTARLGRSLRGFIHPRAIRALPWDVQHAELTRPMVAAIADPTVAHMVTRVLDRYSAEVAPIWPST